jgi:hypothetical protein
MGVALLALLVVVVGVVLVFLAVIVLLVALVALALLGAAGLVAPGALFGVSVGGGLLLLVFALVLIAVGFGLWRGRLWALVLSLVIVGFLLLAGAVHHTIFSLEWLLLLVVFVGLIAAHRHFH